MCTRAQCERYIGKWVRLQTPWGQHVGIIERVTGQNAVILSPRQYVPVGLTSEDVTEDELQRLDLALAWWGGGPAFGGAPYGGYGVPRGYGYGYSGPWARWAVAFLSIFLLWGLLFW